jgi:hypothetical protein
MGAAARFDASAKPLARPSVVSRGVLGTLLTFGLLAIALVAGGRRDYPQLHTVLDTGMVLLSGVLALLLWDLGVRINTAFHRWVALSFGATFLLELVHALVAIEWFGPLAPISQAGLLRPCATCWRRTVTPSPAQPAVRRASTPCGLSWTRGGPSPQ